MTQNLALASRLSVAPMMDWTDRHCRYLHRQFSQHALLYTEMITAPALVQGGAVHLLEFDPAEQPVAVQLGGSDPVQLASAARMAEAAGYPEINLNVGCPSDRVQSGCFGAVLMKQPDLVAACVAAMQDAVSVEVTVKCRIGVDDQTPSEVLPRFLETISAAGVRRVAVHARMAWLQGLSPKENRDVPPLDYALVLAMKQAFPHLHLSVNGGIADLSQAEAFLVAGLDGVMIGRAAYHTPTDILQQADARIFGGAQGPTPETVARQMIPYLEQHLSDGGRVHSVTRHMMGLFAGRAGARAWRRHLSLAPSQAGAGPEVIEDALALVAAAAEVFADNASAAEDQPRSSGQAEPA
ncbi:tRNA dihydrouridine(20/20a) synthase DusA [Pseudoruegeria sp. SK021]|uniref:tRNA dihydrouridine(20/20a) synthase DusA n=1 Tax=Pseudoruegeria sp. SK021 TaxID=1933035 RepID=UPI000A217D7C|nr:tRNA dihydrouridine(20/20a) synthase DusA [Pseudoruegeria sp. SK021]OSP56196.1 tRNA dihydrouridine(20/20a) synthase DusA [Pseudoruegeria sp. SK021]